MFDIVNILRILLLIIFSSFCFLSVLQIIGNKEREEKISGIACSLFGTLQVLVLGFWHDVTILIVMNIGINLLAFQGIKRTKSIVENEDMKGIDKEKASKVLKIFKVLLIANICMHILLGIKCLLTYF